MSHKTLVEGVDTEVHVWFNDIKATQTPTTNPIEAANPITRLNINHESRSDAGQNFERAASVIIHRAFFWNTSPGDELLEGMYPRGAA